MSMFKFFVFDFSVEKYIPLNGVHGADFAKRFAPCDIWFKVPFFHYFSPAFCGFDIEAIKRR